MHAPYTLFASDQFDLSLVSRCAGAFANSLFSHLTLNSIFTALLQLRPYWLQMVFSTPFLRWRRVTLDNHIRVTNGDVNLIPIPIRTHTILILSYERFGSAGWLSDDLLDDFGHPTQTMGRFRRPRRQRLFS